MYIVYNEDRSVYFNNRASCSLIYSEERKVFTLWSLVTRPKEQRNKGFAKGILHEVKKHSESTGVPVRLVASPFSDCPLSLKRLKEFYSKNGFINTDRDEFYYYPKGEGNVGL